MSSPEITRLQEQPQIRKSVADLLGQIQVTDSLLSELRNDQVNYREEAALVLEEIFSIIDRNLISSHEHYATSKEATMTLVHQVPLHTTGFLGLVNTVFIPPNTAKEKYVSKIEPSLKMWLKDVLCPFDDRTNQAQQLLNKFCAYCILQFERNEALRKATTPTRPTRLRAATLPAIDTLAVRRALEEQLKKTTAPTPEAPTPPTIATPNSTSSPFFPNQPDQSPAPQTLTTVVQPPQKLPRSIKVALAVSAGLFLGTLAWTRLRRSPTVPHHTPSILRPNAPVHQPSSTSQLPQPLPSTSTTATEIVARAHMITADSSFLLPEDPPNSSVDVGVRNALWPHRGELASCLRTFTNPYGDQYLTLGLRYLITQQLPQGSGPWQVGAYPSHRGITISWQPGDCQHFTVSGWEGIDESHRRIIHPAQTITIPTPADDVASRRRLFHRLPQDS